MRPLTLLTTSIEMFGDLLKPRWSTKPDTKGSMFMVLKLVVVPH